MMPHTALSHGSANKTCVNPMSKSVEKSLAMRLANEIREAIVSARFDLGEALSEESLAAAFEVSRTPVREALALLQSEGLVNVVAKSGSYVFSPTEDDIVELCEHRVTLEVEASRRALERNPEATLQALRDALAQMIMALEQDDRLAYGAADTEFHLSFFKFSANRYLVDAYERNLGRVAALRTHLARRARHEPDRSFNDHRQMIELAEAGKHGALATLLSRHILRTRESYIATLRERQELAGPNSDRVERIRRKLRL